MEDLRGNAFVEKKLRPYYLRYGVMAVLSIVVLSAALLLGNRVTSLGRASDDLADLKVRLLRSRGGLQEVQAFLDHAASVLPKGIMTDPASSILYSGLDRVKAIAGPVQFTIGKVENKGDEMVMPLTIVGPMRDYRSLIAQIDRLQALSFPFFNAIALSMKTNKGESGHDTVVFEIRGVLCTPQTNKGTQYEGSRQGQGG